MNAPIIFCHYGNSKYLKYSIKLAKINNPDKKVILLGDNQNDWLGKTGGVNHYLFNDFNFGEEIETFDRLYRLIQGKKHKNIIANRDWVNFVFKRWFYINNFLKSNGVDGFWHFDSDTMILDSLAVHEYKYTAYDCTEQCNGMCMNGYVSNSGIVARYIKTINNLFQDIEYLNEQQKEFDEINPEYAFTEMRAYQFFKENENIKSIRLNKVIDGSCFDDCICQKHTMTMEILHSDKLIKKVYLNADGTFYCFDESNNQFVKMNSLNLSRMPNWFFKIVFIHSLKKGPTIENIAPEMKTMSTLSSCVPKQSKALFLIAKIFKSIKNAFSL